MASPVECSVAQHFLRNFKLQIFSAASGNQAADVTGCLFQSTNLPLVLNCWAICVLSSDFML